jgi:hypothetical protein
MVTFSPVEAAPFANTKVASALSRSSLNMINDLPFPCGADATDFF